MPELPEVEVLVRHLQPLLRDKVISSVEVRRARVLRPTSITLFTNILQGAKFMSVRRRAKYLLFEMRPSEAPKPRLLLGHLGMTGRMYLLRREDPLPKHAAVVLGLGDEQFVFEDTRYFGRLTLDTSAIDRLGPEPLSNEFTVENLAAGLARSTQPVKVKLLDQSLIAGLGNIYASEVLFRARISPRIAARGLNRAMIQRLWRAIRQVLDSAVQFGSTVPLDYSGTADGSGLFYYGLAAESRGFYEERLRVYDRAGQPCLRCGTKIRRIVQTARSTFYCPHCQGRS